MPTWSHLLSRPHSRVIALHAALAFFCCSQVGAFFPLLTLTLCESIFRDAAHVHFGQNQVSKKTTVIGQVFRMLLADWT